MSTLIEFTGASNQLEEVSAATPLPVTISGAGSTVNQGSPNGGGADSWPVSVTQGSIDINSINGAASLSVKVNDGVGNTITSNNSKLDVNLNANGNALAATGGATPGIYTTLQDSSNNLVNVTSNGLNVNLMAGGSNVGISGDSIHMRQIASSNVDVDFGTGNAGTETQRVVLASDQPAVAVTPSLPSGASTSTIQTDGSQKTQIVDGSGNVIGATSNALDINIKSGNLSTLPAGTNTLGVAITSPQIGTAFVGTSTQSVISTFANVAASQTDSSLVAGSGSKVIYVLGVQMVTGTTATNVTFNTKPAGAGTAISPLFANGANGGAVLPPQSIPYFKTAAGEGLTVTTGAGSTTGILIQYVQV